MRHNQTEGLVVHFDETWANAHGKKKARVDKDTTTKRTTGGVEGHIVLLTLLLNFYSKPSGKCERLIVLYVDSKDGWIAGKLCHCI